MKLKEKYGSRKFLTMIAGIGAGLALVFGVDEQVVSTVAGAVTAVASAVTYIVTEGRIDAERVKGAVVAVGSAVEAIGFAVPDTTEPP